MKKTILFGLLLLSGCSRMTVHEYCNENGERYKDYDQCYSEVSASGANRSKTGRVIGSLFGGMGQAFTHQPQPEKRQINCTEQRVGWYKQLNCQ